VLVALAAKMLRKLLAGSGNVRHVAFDALIWIMIRAEKPHFPCLDAVDSVASRVRGKCAAAVSRLAYNRFLIA